MATEDDPPPVTLSKRGTIIVRLKARHRAAGLRWVRGAVVAGVAAGVVAVAKLMGGC